MAAELSDGADDTYGFKLALDSVNDDFFFGLAFGEALFTGASNLPGASILGVRISLIDLCMQPTVAGGCPFPGPGSVGFSSTLLIEVSDAPFPRAVAEPGIPALLIACFVGFAASGWRSRLTTARRRTVAARTKRRMR